MRVSDGVVVDDPSNENAAFDRFRWRRHIQKENLSVHDYAVVIAGYGHRRQREELQLSSHLDRTVTLQPCGEAEVRMDNLEGLAPEMARRSIGRLLPVIGGAT